MVGGEGVFEPRRSPPGEWVPMLPEEGRAAAVQPRPAAESAGAGTGGLSTTPPIAADSQAALGAPPAWMARLAVPGALEEMGRRGLFAPPSPADRRALADTADPPPAGGIFQPPLFPASAAGLLDSKGRAAAAELQLVHEDVRHLTPAERAAGILSLVSNRFPSWFRQVLEQISSDYVVGRYPATRWAVTNYLRVGVQAHEAAALRRQQSEDGLSVTRAALARAYAEGVLWLGQHIHWQDVLREGLDTLAIARDHWVAQPLENIRTRLNSIRGPATNRPQPPDAGGQPAHEPTG